MRVHLLDGDVLAVDEMEPRSRNEIADDRGDQRSARCRAGCGIAVPLRDVVSPEPRLARAAIVGEILDDSVTGCTPSGRSQPRDIGEVLVSTRPASVPGGRSNPGSIARHGGASPACRRDRAPSEPSHAASPRGLRRWQRSARCAVARLRSAMLSCRPRVAACREHSSQARPADPRRRGGADRPRTLNRLPVLAPMGSPGPRRAEPFQFRLKISGVDHLAHKMVSKGFSLQGG